MMFLFEGPQKKFFAFAFWAFFLTLECPGDNRMRNLRPRLCIIESFSYNWRICCSFWNGHIPLLLIADQALFRAIGKEVHETCFNWTWSYERTWEGTKQRVFTSARCPFCFSCSPGNASLQFSTFIFLDLVCFKI